MYIGEIFLHFANCRKHGSCTCRKYASYMCRKYSGIAQNCPTCAGTRFPTHAGIICRLLEVVPHMQEVFRHCPKLSYMCRNLCRLPEGVPQEIFLLCERLSYMCRNYSCISMIYLHLLKLF